MPTNSTSSADRPVALITGAGSGIGRATAILLAKERFGLALVGRNEDKLATTADLIGSEASCCIAADVARPDAARDVVDRTLDRFARLDVLINNAGAVVMRPLADTTQDLLNAMFAVNVFGPIHLIARAWPWWAANGGGCVVNVSSMSAVDPFPGLSAYAAAKSALEGFTRAVHNEGRSLGIRAFTVAPGAVETDMLRSIASERDLPKSQTLDPEAIARVIVDCVIGRREEDIGRTIQLTRR